MNTIKFSINRLLFYFLSISLFLFVSSKIGQHLIVTQGMDRQIAMLLQGVIFTGLTLLVLYILKRKNSEVLNNMGLKPVKSPLKLIIGMALPVILLLLGILTAYLLGGIENISLNLTKSVIISVLINIVTAFMYEAFPEEVFIRGLIFEELHKKFRFIISLIMQPLIFICVPIMVMTLEFIFFSKPFAITIDYIILLFTFGIALQLYKKYTGTLWMSIIFHIIYLEVARYISIGGMHDQGVALLRFDEAFDGFMILYLSFLFIVVFSVVVLSILLLLDSRKKKL